MAKKILIYIINFILVIFIFSFTILLVINSTVLNKQYVLNILQKNNYYEQINHLIEKSFKNNVIQSGLEESILEDLYDEEKINNDINMVIDVIYENKEMDIDTSEIKEKLDNRINAILQENNMQPNSEEREEIEAFEDAITNAYTNEIVYAEKYVEEIANAFEMLQPLLLSVRIAIGALIVIFIIITIIITKDMKYTIRTLGISLLSVGIINITIKILVGKRIHNILVLNATFSRCLIDLISSLINMIFNIGIMMSILGVMGIILGNYKKRYSRH